MDSCEYAEANDQAFLYFAITLPIFIALQITLLSNTFYHEYTRRKSIHNNPDFQPQPCRPRIFYIILQLIGLSWTITDVFRYLLDPHLKILRSNTTTYPCKIIAFSPRIIPFLFYLVFLYQVLMRIKKSFEGSHLEISKCNFRILAVLPMTTVAAIIAFFFLNKQATTCLALWEPWDFTSFHSDEFTFCFLPIGSNELDGDNPAIFAYAIAILCIPILNIVYGAIFSAKLNKLMSKESGNEEVKLEFKALVVKNSILTLTGSISTIVCYTVWIFTQIDPLLYLDLFVNCLVIGLMFKYNEKRYKRICRCLILLCFLECDRSKNRIQEEQVSVLYDYINTETDLDEILNSISPRHRDSVLEEKKNRFRSISGTSAQVELGNGLNFELGKGLSAELPAVMEEMEKGHHVNNTMEFVKATSTLADLASDVDENGHSSYGKNTSTMLVNLPTITDTRNTDQDDSKYDLSYLSEKRKFVKRESVVIEDNEPILGKPVMDSNQSGAATVDTNSTHSINSSSGDRKRESVDGVKDTRDGASLYNSPDGGPTSHMRDAKHAIL